MRFLAYLRSLASKYFHRSETESDLDEEVRSHVRQRADDLERSGLDRTEAERRARVEFGGFERYKEECRDALGSRLLGELIADARYGLRMLMKNPGFASASILALALGIAANTVIFTAYNAVALRPMQAAHPTRVVNIYKSGLDVGAGQFFSYPDYVYFRDHNKTFSSLIVSTGTDLSFSPTLTESHPARSGRAPSSLFGIRFFQQISGGAEFAAAAVVSESYFSALGINPTLGRSFTADDGQHQYPVVMLSHDFWKRRFNSDAHLVGKTVKLNGKAFTVIGITPRDFMGTYPNIPAVWVPVESLPLLEPKNNLWHDPDDYSCRMYGRLKPGVTREQAQAELTVLAEQLRKTYPAGSEHSKPVTMIVAPGSPFTVGDRAPAKVIGLILLGATSLVLLIACANVAGLQLARSAARQREIGVRLALGAGRGRLVRQLLTEATMLAVMAGGFGLLLAWGAMRALLRTVSVALPAVWGTIALQVEPDLHVFAYTLAVSIVAGVVFGLAPALEASKPNLTFALKEEGSALGTKLAKSRLRNILIATQMGTSLVLLVAAGLLARGSYRAVKFDPGFKTKNVLGMDIEIPVGLGYDATQRGQIVRELVDRFETVSGVRDVARGRVPLGGGVRNASVSLSGDRPSETAPVLSYSYVSRSYFDLLGIPIVRGRSFTEAEARSGAQVTVVSEATARKLWPGQESLGKRVTLDAAKQFHSSDEPFPSGQSFQVIGVIRDLSSNWLGKVDDGYFYLPMPPDRWYDTILLRTEGDPYALLPQLSEQTNAVDSNVVVFAETLDGLMTNNPPFVFSRIAAVVSVVIGLLGLLLASVGIYGMVSFVVVQRTHEVGVRMALGARASDVLAMILRQSMKPVAIGMLFGVAGAAGISRLLSALLFGLNSLDPLAFLGVSALLALVAASASYIPARRATKVDPMAALRHE